MSHWIKSLGKTLANGFCSIAEGMSSLSIWPSTDYEALARRLQSREGYKQYLESLGLEEGFKADRDALRKDREALFKPEKTSE